MDRSCHAATLAGLFEAGIGKSLARTRSCPSAASRCFPPALVAAIIKVSPMALDPPWLLDRTLSNLISKKHPTKAFGIVVLHFCISFSAWLDAMRYSGTFAFPFTESASE